VNAQHRIRLVMDGTYPAGAVSAGSASIPAPMAVPAKRSAAPVTLPSSDDDDDGGGGRSGFVFVFVACSGGTRRVLDCVK